MVHSRHHKKQKCRTLRYPCGIANTLDVLTRETRNASPGPNANFVDGSFVPNMPMTTFLSVTSVFLLLNHHERMSSPKLDKNKPHIQNEMFTVSYWGRGIPFDRRLSQYFALMEEANNYANLMLVQRWDIEVSAVGYHVQLIP